jgi:uncharacterized membrane protein
MFHLFFGSLFSTLTTVLVIGQLAFAAFSIQHRQEITHWGRRLLLFILVGLAVSGLSAMRDSYMMANARFAADGMQSMICSIAGGVILLTGISTVFVRNQTYRQTIFLLAAGLFTVQVLTIEISRLAQL